jgi:hypothetical protein
MEKTNWNYVRAHILIEALEESRAYITENKRIALYNILKEHFKGKIVECIKTELYYLNYDMPLFHEICTYISEEEDFIYIAKPKLRKKELNAIKTGIDTIMVMIFHCKDTMPKIISTLKFCIASELSESYDIASPEFIEWYEEIFLNLPRRIDSEIHSKDVDVINRNSNQISSQIDEVDHELFTKICLYIRSLFADNLNYFIFSH